MNNRISSMYGNHAKGRHPHAATVYNLRGGIPEATSYVYVRGSKLREVRSYDVQLGEAPLSA